MMAKCKDCLHFEACKYMYEAAFSPQLFPFGTCDFGTCDQFKDRSRFVELPCNVGDTVYAVRRCSCHRQDDTPWNSCIGKVALKSNKGIARACLYVSPTPFKVKHLSQIGKTVFLTREEAEADLARRTANG